MLPHSQIRLSIVIWVLTLSVSTTAFSMPIPNICQYHFHNHWWNEAGQLVASIDNASCDYYGYDGTGSEEFAYDHLGNVAQSVRRIVVPTENQAYVFRTLFKYDSFGRIRNIIYPDGEVVHYGYTTGGLLKNVVGLKQGDNSVYLWNRVYDEQGRKIFQLAGNGVWTRYGYDPARQWLKELHTELPNGEVLQDLHYLYDAAGNSTDIEQSAPHTGNGLGGKYDNHYLYDRQYRLVQSDGWGDFTYTFKADYSPSGRLGNKFTKASALTTDLVFGYDFNRQTHQPRTIFDPQVGTLEFFWDANGNLAQMIGCKQNAGRLHEWDEENRLRFVLGEKFAGYYGYDANGERVYKLLGTSSIDQINSGSTKAQAVFDYAVLYPNPYIVVTPKGYTKHYYAGTERLAAVIGSGGLGNMVSLTAPLGSQHDQDIIKPFYTHYQNYDPFYYHGTISQPEKTEDIAGENHPDLDYQCKPTDLVMVDILPKQDILLGSISQNASINGQEKEVYFYHGDHLGSANWITDFTGTPIQYIHYAPYGELVENQHAASYDERYKFTGKERDMETGYDYFGARFYWTNIGHWLSVDPLANKYPNISPYAYCAWNPIKFVDPDGNKIVVGSWLGRTLANLGFNNFEAKVQSQLQELKDMDPELNKMITKIEESSTEYHIMAVDGDRLSYNNSKKEIRYNPDSQETKSGKKRPAQIGLAHELGHAENDIDGTTVKYDKDKADNGDQKELDKWNRNEINSIDKENIVREKYNCEERPYNYFIKENY